MTEFEGVHAHPLSWPSGWPRAKRREYNGRFGDHSMARASKRVLEELERMHVPDWNVIISTNVELRQDGLPYSNRRRPDDPAAAVYFRVEREPHVLACDRWDRVEHNIWAIAKHIEALRGMDRWGVGSVRQAFAGYKALPESTSAVAVYDHWGLIGLPRFHSTAEDVRSAFRSLAPSAHPDRGGDPQAFQRLVRARDLCLADLGVT